MGNEKMKTEITENNLNEETTMKIEETETNQNQTEQSDEVLTEEEQRKKEEKKQKLIETLIVAGCVTAILAIIAFMIYRSNLNNGEYRETRIAASDPLTAEEAGIGTDADSSENPLDSIEEEYEYMRVNVTDKKKQEEDKKKEEQNQENQQSTPTPSNNSGSNNSGNSNAVSNSSNSGNSGSNVSNGGSAGGQNTSSGISSYSNNSGSSGSSQPSQSSSNTNPNNNGAIQSATYTYSGTGNSNNNSSNSNQTAQQSAPATSSSNNNNNIIVGNSETATTTKKVKITPVPTTITHEKTPDGQYEIVVKYDKNNKPSQAEIDKLIDQYIEAHKEELYTPSEEENVINVEDSIVNTPTEEPTPTPSKPKKEEATHGNVSIGGALSSSNDGSLLVSFTEAGYAKVTSMKWHVEAINGEATLSDTDSPLAKNIHITDGSAAKIYVTVTFEDGFETESNFVTIKHADFKGVIQ